MKDPAPQAIRLEDYKPANFLIDEVALVLDLDEHATRVRARLSVRRNPAGEAGAPLVLDGQNMKLRSVALDGEPLGANRYRVEPESLTIPDVPAAFALEIENEIDPGANSALEGLFVSNGMFCTQCEAEGFRNITYFLDRPDVMARFTTEIRAGRERFPVLLSNGNLVAEGALEGSRHFARWEDPFLKPAYLFALVAGRLEALEDRFTTRSGREVTLRIWVEPKDRALVGHAMASLKRAMKWDEEVFGLEYDLDIFNIVAVSHFNMGAMENKSLNIFNSKLLLASPETATDDEYARIEAVIAHEYFHNWTGNRVTCRDWFQLSLKEGLTVFRDQEFSADMGSRPVTRIDDIRVLRAMQFPEDAGPTAHPVRPDSYIEVNNFYTATVYEKGATVVRMIHTLLGAEGFRRGMDLYFERHDGQAVTCDDFVSAMEDANGADLSQFRLWYSQAGTPKITARSAFDEESGTFRITLAQEVPQTPGQREKRPAHIPVAVGLVGPDGCDLPLRLSGEAEGNAGTRVLDLKEREQTFIFEGIETRPVPSLLRDFSAPVKLETDLGDGDLIFLMAHDADPVNRWEAGQQLAAKIVDRLIASRAAGQPLVVEPAFAEAFRHILVDPGIDDLFRALALTLPSEIYLAELRDEVDVDAIHEVREFLRRALAAAASGELLETYETRKVTGPYDPRIEDRGRRALRNLALSYLVSFDEAAHGPLASGQLVEADNMTETMGALQALASSDLPARLPALDAFYERWKGDALVLDKWFTLQAASARPDTLDNVERLARHPDFTLDSPNRVRALVSAFAGTNQVRFHDPSGRGYRFLADHVLALDPLNPQLAARTLQPLTKWRKHTPARRALMMAELGRILETAGLSKDSYEIASKALA